MADNSANRRIRTRATPEPEEIVEDETLVVTRTHVVARQEIDGTTKKKTLKVRRFKVEPAFVRVSSGTTKNLGNYESMRIDVSITLPCYAEEIDDVVPVLADKVAKYVDEEIKLYE